MAGGYRARAARISINKPSAQHSARIVDERMYGVARNSISRRHQRRGRGDLCAAARARAQQNMAWRAHRRALAAAYRRGVYACNVCHHIISRITRARA